MIVCFGRMFVSRYGVCLGRRVITLLMVLGSGVMRFCGIFVVLSSFFVCILGHA
jgi:hypothetical protein